MKHVFVETNFLIDLLRPFPGPDAQALFARIGTDVTLYLPWVSVTEAKRTLKKIIDEDLDFADDVAAFRVQQLKAGAMTHADQSPFEAFEKAVKMAHTSAIQSVESCVDSAATSMNVIPPSASVVAKTVSMYPVKSLPPFDEMVIGAVLAKAAELAACGTDDLYFCNKNTKDFDPSRGNLKTEYDAIGLKFLAGFRVPA